MKTIIAALTLTALAGCVVAPPAPANYGTRLAPQGDPSQWQVVSVTPVPLGTGARAGSDQATTTTAPQYSSAPVATQVYTPVYVQQPVYVPAPVYVQDPYYYYPPVSLSLGFVFGRGGWGGHGRGWGGARVGGGWHR